MKKLIGLVLSTLLAVSAPSSVFAQAQPLGYNPVCNNTQVSSCQFKNSGGQLFNLHAANWAATAITLFIVDVAPGNAPTTGNPVCSAALIAAGTCVVFRSYPLGVGAATSPSFQDIDFTKAAGPILFVNGILVLCSTTGQSGGVNTYTASASCTFDAETH